MEPIRGVRRRRDALRAAEDLLDAGRSLLVRRDRGGPEARDQALERRAADPSERRGRRRRDARPQSARGALDPRAPRRRPRASSRTAWARFDFAESTGDALPPDLRRLLRLVRRGDQAAALRPRPGGDRDRARRARATARAAAPGDAARDRGDLVAASRSRGAPDRRRRGRARTQRFAADAARSTASRRRRRSSAAAASRSSSARTTSAGSSPRSSRPSAPGRRRPRRGGRTAAQGDRARRRAMLANERFVANAPAEVVAAEREKLERYRRELAALGG